MNNLCTCTRLCVNSLGKTLLATTTKIKLFELFACCCCFVYDNKKKRERERKTNNANLEKINEIILTFCCCCFFLYFLYIFYSSMWIFQMFFFLQLKYFCVIVLPKIFLFLDLKKKFIIKTQTKICYYSTLCFLLLNVIF